MDHCSLCRTELLPGSSELWTTEDGVSVDMANTAQPSASADTSLGPLDICEECYLHSLPAGLTEPDLAEIHFQFGLDYRDRGQLDLSIGALERAVQLNRGADALAELAAVYERKGLRQMAVQTYRRALDIDPQHFIATENLKVLERDPG